MAIMEYLTIKGASAALYRFDVYPINVECPGVGGVYDYTKRSPAESPGGGASHSLIYIGKTNSFRRRDKAQEDNECINKADPNCICLYPEGNDERRLTVEKDIISAHKPQCNAHHAT
jgi:hypothetical protein